MSNQVLSASALATEVGMLSTDEVELIHRCAEMLPVNPVIVNIGANVGTSAIAFLEARKDAFIFSIDKRPCPEEPLNLVRANLEARRVVRVLGDSAKVGEFWPYPVHLVFVDGNHADEAVRADIMAWKDRILPGGLMLFHDYNHPNLPTLPGIVNRLMRGSREVGRARFLIGFQL